MKNQKGISLYLALMIMTILLTIALGISALLFSQIKIIREMGNSVIAFYAAETGIERTLMERENPSDVSETVLDNGAKYRATVIPAGANCSANNFCIQSVGEYKETKRAIEITY
ncbi:hypothetical protein ACFL0A_01290 [Patescibacteria group bacterium]